MEASDETLVSQVLTLGDVAAFEQLVRRHQPRVLLLQKRLVKDPAIAEDLCQETFFRAWNKLRTFRATGRFRAWLTKLAYNVFLQHYRHARRTPKYMESIEQRSEEDRECLPMTGTADELPDLPKLLAVLTDEEQTLMVLNYAHGLSNSEISDVLGIPTGTIKSRIHRAKDKIRQRFEIGGPV
ncbi:MAG: RNA polymerase sigma factor [Gammaproteobacteria bacterium]|nr:RNA polymerase sigma factor [Gammaproteobacteria bacterium]